MNQLWKKHIKAICSVWFVLALAIWSGLALYGIFGDLNVSIQEGTNIEETFRLLVRGDGILRWFLAGNNYGHQRLYHLLILGLAKILGQVNNSGLLLIGRLTSLLLGVLSVLLTKRFFEKFLPEYNAKFISLFLMFHPLFFFYSQQSEPYSLLFFWTILSLFFYFFIKISKNKWLIVAFSTITILGYFTHFYFLLVLLAEVLAEFLQYFKIRKTTRVPIFLLLNLFPLFIYQFLPALDSGLKYFIDGYFSFSPLLFLKIFGVFYGLTPLFFSDFFISLLTIIVFIYTTIYFLKKNNDVPLVFRLFYFLLLGCFFVFNIITTMYGYVFPVMRHSICVTLPILFIIGTLSKKRLSLIFLICCLYVFVGTDILTLTKKYRTDGLSVGKYVRQLSGKTLVVFSPEWAIYSLYTIPFDKVSFASYSQRNHLIFRTTEFPDIATLSKDSVICFLRISEYILGLDYIDTVHQDNGLQKMLNNPNLNLIDIKYFTNIVVYTFVK